MARRWTAERWPASEKGEDMRRAQPPAGRGQGSRRSLWGRRWLVCPGDGEAVNGGEVAGLVAFGEVHEGLLLVHDG
eukprot:CAMPEP_0194316224 /NCGR_PEP_ID=MMETSP0171-20130528/13038_1 /TAXON_ID=218684 /ORGANISM="Corethron pennatum, Strain L29A3" /LENGTH=75 /DNA_ID=CAMNT_0039072389 /DNA_START=446 /DNA_END=673 /DNA_ORIENTATION=-